jgi:WD40 repeat protein
VINTQAVNVGPLLKFSPDGRLLVVGSGEGVDYVVDVQAAGEAPTVNFGFGGIYWAALSPDSRWLGTQIQTPDNRDETLVWNVATGQVSRTLNMPASGAQFSTDSQWLMLESEVLNIVTGQTLKLPSPALIFSASGRFALLNDSQQSNPLHLWDVAAQREVTTISSTLPVALNFSPDDRYLAVAAGGIVHIQEIATAREVKTWSDQKFINLTSDGLRFLPDGIRLAIRDDSGAIQIWPIGAGQPITLDVHAGQVLLEFSSDSQLMVTFDANASTAQIWRTATGERVAELRGPEEGVIDAQFSTDGRLIVTTHADRTAHIWDAVTGRELSILRGHQASGIVAQFQTDGRRVVTADPTGTTLIEPVLIGDLLALARTRVTRDLTCEEHSLYLREIVVCPTPTPAR